MAEIIVPELAESITEGTISQWLKKPGETVERGEFIVELETDKVNVRNHFRRGWSCSRTSCK